MACDLCRTTATDQLRNLARRDDGGTLTLCRRCIREEARIVLTRENANLEPYMDRIAADLGAPVWEVAGTDILVVLPHELLERLARHR